MCRMILAKGQFSVQAVLDAAVAMSTGRTANGHDGMTEVHPNGWGALWRRTDGTFGVHRDIRSIADSIGCFAHGDIETDLLVVHVRHATLPRNHGARFTHPLHRDGELPWYFMHNGFMPTVHKMLSLPKSEFDSLEYFDYIVPTDARTLEEHLVLERLRAIPSGGNSGNAIAVNPTDVYVIHWSPPDTPSPVCFGMAQLVAEKSFIVSSEIIPELAPRNRWEPLAPDQLLRLPLTASVK